jgi:NAD(P)-dependent dehydrogenase (short-subunit alcohol dehydrogenase family)
MLRTWFITGPSRGLGWEIAKAALRGADRVVADYEDRRILEC